MNARESTTQSGAGSDGKILLVLLLILELLLLIPWALFSAFSGIGFDTGFAWPIVVLMLPFWAYPLLLLMCSIVAFVIDGKGRLGLAVAAMIAAPIVSWGCFFALVGNAAHR
jgi:hypothetical protein